MDNDKDQATIKLLVKLYSDKESAEQELAKTEAIIKRHLERIKEDDKRFTDASLRKKIENRDKWLKKVRDTEQEIRSISLKTSKEVTNRRVTDEKAADKKILANKTKSETKATQTYVSKWKSAFATLTRYASSYAIINAVVQSFKYLASELLAVQQNLSRVAAISGATNTEMKKMETVVYNVSAAYGKSASEVSKFTIEMAKLGKTSSEINGIANSAAQLSVILGEDMVTSGTLMVTTMNQYGLSVQEAGRVTSTFFDVIAKSPADVKGLQTALQYLGVTARATGFSIEETGTMVAFLARNGIKMSKIGTGLRNVLSKLARMGGDVKETMEAIAESGISVEEAFKNFGIRGGNVALLLLQNWGKVKRLMEDGMPTAASTMLRSAKAMSNWLTKWEMIKAAIVGGLSGHTGAIQKAGEASDIRGFAKFLDNEGVSIEKFDESLKKYLKRGMNAKAIVEAFKKDYGIDDMENASKYAGGAAMRYVTQIVSGLEISVEESKKQYDLDKALNEFRKKIRTKAQDITNQYIQDHKDVGKLINQIVTDKDGNRVSFYNMVFLGYRKILGDKEAQRATESFFALWNNRSNEIKRNYKDINKRISEYEDQKKTVEELIKKASKGTVSPEDVDNAKDQRDKMLKIICTLTGGAYAGCKSSISLEKKRTKRTILDELKKIEDDYKVAIAEARSAGIGDISKLQSLGDVSINGQKKPLSFESYMISLGFDPNTMNADEKKNLLAKYAQSSMRFIEDLSVRVHSAADKLREASLKDYQRKSAVEAAAIKKEKDMLPLIDKSTAAYSSTLSKIAAHKANLIKLNSDYVKTTNKVTNSEKTHIESLKELAKKLGITAEQLDKLLDVDKRQQKLDVIKQIINAAADIYKKFNDEAYRNTQDRLNAETEAIRSHYTEAGDVLRAQLENNLITEGQYAKRRKNLEKKRIDETNKIKKAEFETRKKQDIENAIVEGVAAAAMAYIENLKNTNLIAGMSMGTIAAGIIALKTTAEIGAISSRKFYPVKYETGGWIDGQPHASGGVPFSINNNAGFEAEGGEFIVKKQAAARNAALLETVNSGNDFEEQLVKALEKARIRAYFTDKDLDAAERMKSFNTNSVNYI